MGAPFNVKDLKEMEMHEVFGELLCGDSSDSRALTYFNYATEKKPAKIISKITEWKDLKEFLQSSNLKYIMYAKYHSDADELNLQDGKEIHPTAAKLLERLNIPYSAADGIGMFGKAAKITASNAAEKNKYFSKFIGSLFARSAPNVIKLNTDGHEMAEMGKLETVHRSDAAIVKDLITKYFVVAAGGVPNVVAIDNVTVADILSVTNDAKAYFTPADDTDEFTNMQSLHFPLFVINNAVIKDHIAEYKNKSIAIPTAFKLNVNKILKDKGEFMGDSYDYFVKEKELHNKYKETEDKAMGTLKYDDLLTNKCVIGTHIECNDALNKIFEDCDKSGFANKDLPQVIEYVRTNIRPSLLIAMFEKLQIVYDNNGRRELRTFEKWVSRITGRILNPGNRAAITDDATSCPHKFIRAGMELLSANPKLLNPTLGVKGYPIDTIAPSSKPQWGTIYEFTPRGVFGVKRNKFSSLDPGKEVNNATLALRALMGSAGMFDMAQQGGLPLLQYGGSFNQMGGDPDEKSPAAEIFDGLFTTLYDQIRLTGDREVEQGVKDKVNKAIMSLSHYDKELRKFLKDLGMFREIANMFKGTPQGSLTEGVIHKAVAKYKNCLEKQSNRERVILNVAQQMCDGAR